MVIQHYQTPQKNTKAVLMQKPTGTCIYVHRRHCIPAMMIGYKLLYKKV